MIEIQYSSKDYASLVWKEIDEGRAVSLRISGWKSKFIYRLVLMFIEYDQLSRKGQVSRGLYFGLGWRSLFALSIMGLCHHARSAGMAVAAYENGAGLEIKFGEVDTAG